MDIPPERGDRFEAFIAPATGRPALWRLAAGAVMAVGLWMLAILALLPFGTGARPRLLLFLASFAALTLGCGLAVRLLQGRRFVTLIGPGGFRLGHFALGAAVVLGLALLSAVLPFSVAPAVRQQSVAVWALWVPVVLALLLVQTSAEEIVFRGYLTQGLAARFRSPLVWWLLPALLFGVLHWSPADYGRDTWLVVASAVVMGFVLAHVTVRTGNLSAAIGLHFANNAVALLVLALPSPLASFSLWLIAIEPGDAPARRLVILLDLAATLLAWAGWLFLDARLRRLHSGGAGSI